ncbi:MAG: hypothetical protein DWQ45_17320 [Planctomycetota bacterium]|nr:MAG: hypothetical protein DWQ41_18725 [Planctomycetota bacterium]REK32408.1 MAG: hypothetical protein DWQ45_17320 [Planctomycetota bacterium]
MSRHVRSLAAVAILTAGSIVAAHATYRYFFPYGWSHCCDKQLYFALLHYADMNGGSFPSGGPTPEASLGQIHATRPEGYAYLLCGKTGSEMATQQILDQDLPLDESSCGWNYVEGLRADDDGRLALFWDREGLGHNGERLSGGGHVVMFVDGATRHIPESEWEAFLHEQQELHQQRHNVQQVEQSPEVP